jgi:hypothetical protein
MRCWIFISAILLSACQGDEPIGEATSPPNEVAMSGGEIPITNATTNDPDMPVSSDNPTPPASQPDEPAPDCPIIRSSDWHAHVNAMPGPGDNPRLIVSGKVTVPTGGYKLALRMGAVAESYPVQVTVHLDAVPPKGMATQALETREVRGSWRSEERVGSVTVRCGARMLAQLSDIETAR